MYSQINPRIKYLRTIVDTAWSYPSKYITSALLDTTIPYSANGGTIVADSEADIDALIQYIYAKTDAALSGGFSIGVSSVLQDLGHKISFQISGGAVFAEFRLMRLIKQNGGGNAPDGTIGYVSTFYARGGDGCLTCDPVRVVRTG